MKVERRNCNLKFINVKQNLQVHPESISKTDVTNEYLEHKFELNLLKTKCNTEKNIESTALLMRENKRHETHYALSP